MREKYTRANKRHSIKTKGGEETDEEKDMCTNTERKRRNHRTNIEETEFRNAKCGKNMNRVRSGEFGSMK